LTDEAKFRISGRVSWHDCVAWGIEPLREHSEHERDSPEVNVWCALTHEKVIGRVFFDEDIITSSSFPDMSLIFFSPATTAILFFLWTFHCSL
jgi:hypothetical protein